MESKVSAMEITVQVSGTPDYRGPLSDRDIRPNEVRMNFFPSSTRYPAGQRFGQVTGPQVKKDGAVGQVVATYHTPLDVSEWPTWVTEIFDQYQPSW